jgi:hypothetical protein
MAEPDKEGEHEQYGHDNQRHRAECPHGKGGGKMESNEIRKRLTPISNRVFIAQRWFPKPCSNLMQRKRLLKSSGPHQALVGVSAAPLRNSAVPSRAALSPWAFSLAGKESVTWKNDAFHGIPHLCQGHEKGNSYHLISSKQFQFFGNKIVPADYGNTILQLPFILSDSQNKCRHDWIIFYKTLQTCKFFLTIF